MRTILVTGGTGFIGRALIDQLLEREFVVTVLTRSPHKAKLPKVVQMIDTLPVGADWQFDIVINLAGENLFESRWNERSKQRFLDSRVRTTSQLVQRLTEQQRTSLLISGSAIGYYGAGTDLPSEDDWQTEQALPGKDFSARLCINWENEARKAESLGIATALLRTGVVLDPAGGALQRMLLPFKLGAGGRLGSGKQWFSWISRDDLVRLILFVIDQHDAGQPVSGPWNGTSPNPVRNMPFTRALGEVLNRPTVLPMPAWFLRLAMGESAQLLLGGKRVSPQRALQAGFSFTDEEVQPALRRMLT